MLPSIGTMQPKPNTIQKNIFLTGAPSVGKTTVIKKVIQLLRVPSNGFYTEEELMEGKRVGFLMRTLDGKKAYLAHQDIHSDFHIRRYGASIENIETIAVSSIAPIENHVIVIDEIGKMECFSQKFVEASAKALDAPNIVIGTIALGGTAYIQQVKARDDIQIFEVTPDNRNALPQLIVQAVHNMTENVLF